MDLVVCDVCENILTLMDIVAVYTKCLYVIVISILLRSVSFIYRVWGGRVG